MFDPQPNKICCISGHFRPLRGKCRENDDDHLREVEKIPDLIFLHIPYYKHKTWQINLKIS